jgi:hypothetical protein
MEKRWMGQTVCCLASGPSLTLEDCKKVAAVGIKTIVTNCTFEMAPWAEVVFAVDFKWWERYHLKVPSSAECWTTSRQAVRDFSVKHFDSLPPQNSGQQAIKLAAYFGARRIILLGYDAQLTGGKTHHHGDHIPGLGNPNANKCAMWRVQFARIAQHYRSQKIEIINCSRKTALSCFPIATLEDVL